MVILDPPAFTKSRSSVKKRGEGLPGDQFAGMKLVKDGGFLATCSCSHFMDPELFAKTIREAARSAESGCVRWNFEPRLRIIPSSGRRTNPTI